MKEEGMKDCRMKENEDERLEVGEVTARNRESTLRTLSWGFVTLWL